MISSHKTSNDKMVRGYGLDKLGICVTLVEVFVSGPTAASKGSEEGGVAAARSSKTSCRLQRYARNLRQYGHTADDESTTKALLAWRFELTSLPPPCRHP
jgi:hypothetical protein